MRNVIALVDCDNFFVSCERVFRPELRTVPVLVLSSNDGCVISRSEEVKRMGIPMGAPYFTVRDLCKRQGVAVFSTNFSLYGDMSARVMRTLRYFSHTVEAYSIDEAFVTLTYDGNPDSLYRRAREIRSVVWRDIGVPVSVGVAYTKTLAKVATLLAKPKHGGSGSMVLTDRKYVEDVLEHVPLNDVWGIGKGFSNKLERFGVRTARDLYDRSVTWVRDRVGILGVCTYLELHGKRHYSLEERPDMRKSLMYSRSFGAPLCRLEDIEGKVVRYARKVAEILRGERILVREVHVCLYVQGKKGRHERVCGMEVFDVHTNSTLTIVTTAVLIMRRLHVPHATYVKAGVYTRGVLPVDALPTHTLFSDTSSDTLLMGVIDGLQRKFGDVVRIASEVGGGYGDTRSSFRSPSYTTQWSDVPVVQNTMP